MTVAAEPAWLTLFRRRATGKEVATCWLESLDEEARTKAKENEEGKLTARARFRRAIIDSECPEVRADAKNGWKYTAEVMRGTDEVLDIPPPKVNREGRMTAPGTVPFRPKHICKGDERPGALNLWWSDYDTAVQARRLREECGITHRLNVAIEVVPKFTAEDDAFVKTVHIPMEDSFNPDEQLNREWPEQLQQALDTLRGWRDEGVVVNVNCQMGKNRSGAVILMWLCCECGWDLEGGVQHLRDMNPLACGNPHLLAAMTKVLGVDDIKVPLNPAADGGGWVCISPPGSPRAGGAEVFDKGFAAGGLEEAANRVAHLTASREPEAGQPAVSGAGYSPSQPPQAVVEELAEEAEEHDEVEEAAGDMGALFSELSDVD